MNNLYFDSIIYFVNLQVYKEKMEAHARYEMEQTGDRRAGSPDRQTRGGAEFERHRHDVTAKKGFSDRYYPENDERQDADEPSSRKLVASKSALQVAAGGKDYTSESRREGGIRSNVDKSRSRSVVVPEINLVDASRKVVEESIPDTHVGISNRLEIIQRQKQMEEMVNDARSIVRLLRVRMTESLFFPFQNCLKFVCTLISGILSSIKESEKQEFIPEEFECVLRLASGDELTQYLKSNWSDKVTNVIAKVKAKGIVGPDSTPKRLARTSLAECEGDVNKAVEVFEKKWNEKVH